MEKKFLIEHWLKDYTNPIAICDGASVALARQTIKELCLKENFPREITESLLIIVSELAHNQEFHAKQGYISARAIARDGVRGIEVIAADLGPGIANLGQSFRGGHSTRGSLGEGLSAVSRLSDELDVDTRIGHGTCITARKFASPISSLCGETTILSYPYPGEEICGDDAAIIRSKEGLLACVSDGLGHGPLARQASFKAVQSFSDHHNKNLSSIGLEVDLALQNTRGCAMGFMRMNQASRQLECLLAGDISAQLYRFRESQFFSGTPFTLGQGQSIAKKPRVETALVGSGAIFLMFSDDFKSGTNLKDRLDILNQPTPIIADYLMTNFARKTDDALLLVARLGNKL